LVPKVLRARKGIRVLRAYREQQGLKDLRVPQERLL
jgi:hypothetical protein